MPIEIRPFTKEDRDGSGDQDLTARATWFLVQHMSCSRPIAASSLPTPDAIVGTIKLIYAMPHGGGSDDPVRKAKSFICSLSNTDESILFSPGEKNLSDPAYLLWYSAHRYRIEVGGPPSLDMEDGTIDTLAEYEGEPFLDNNDGGDLDTPTREASNMSPSGSSSASASSSRSSSAPVSSTPASAAAPAAPSARGRKYTRVYAETDGARSLHDDVNSFMSKHMGGLNKKMPTQTELLTVMKAVMLNNKKEDDASRQLIRDLQATKLKDLWPDQDHPEPNLYGKFWVAAARRLRNKTGYEDADDVAEETHQLLAHVEAIPNPHRRGGRVAGQVNWSEEEYDDLLNIQSKVHAVSALGFEEVARQFAKVAAEKGRDIARPAGGCRSAWDKLVAKKAPTGDPYMPRLVERARQIREAIKADQVSGEAALNDDAIPVNGKGLSGTKLVDPKTGEMKSTTPRRGKLAIFFDKMDDVQEAVVSTGGDVTDAIREMTAVLKESPSDELDGSDSKEIEGRLSKLEEKMDVQEEKLDAMHNLLLSIAAQNGIDGTPAPGSKKSRKPKRKVTPPAKPTRFSKRSHKPPPTSDSDSE